MKESRLKSKKVLVLGGGIAGATVADRLSRAGLGIHLVERGPAIGGRVADMGCKATAVCQKCHVCAAAETLRTVRDSAAIRVHTGAQVEALQPGRNGTRFSATLTPAPATDGTPATSVYQRRQVSPTPVEARRLILDVDAVVVATGYKPSSPRENASFGYGLVPNVITGEDAERQLAKQRRLTRPSDGAAPRRIAFVQCVGSRTEEVNRRPESADYCSTVCCAYSLRIARLIKHQAADAEIAVFYMDIQNFGKDFNALYADCRRAMRFVRARPYSVEAAPEGRVRIRYAPEASAPAGTPAVLQEDFDLLVLAVGIRPADDSAEVAERLRLPTDPYGFLGLKTGDALPDTQAEGVFVAGACEGPKDIAGTIAQAEAVCARLLAGLHSPSGLAKPARTKTMPAHRGVAVIGGGVAGMQAAAGLAALGHPVALIHQDERLGGLAAAMPELFGYLDTDAGETTPALKASLDALASRLTASAVDVRAGSAVTAIEGELGGFIVRTLRQGTPESFACGAVIVATGTPRALQAPEGNRVVPWQGLLDAMRAGAVPRRVALLVDAQAEQGRGVFAQVLSAADALVRRFGCAVRIFCHQSRVASPGIEELYRRVRSSGVVFTRTDRAEWRITPDSRLRVEADDGVAGVRISEEFDLAVLADAAASRPDPLAGLIDGLRTGPDQGLQFDNVWLTPTLTTRPGVFVAGGARGNSEYRDALADGLAAAGAVHALLGSGQVEIREDAATVDSDKCVLCLTCVRTCPHGAIRVDAEKEAALVSPVSCQRCGVCVAECPAKAIDLPRYTDREVDEAVGTGPDLAIFACENSAIPAAEAAAFDAAGAGVRLIRVPCAGRVDPRAVLAALETGARRAILIGCHPESCQFMSGASRAASRIQRLKAVLEKAGIDSARVSFHGIAAVEPSRFSETVAAARDSGGIQA